MIYELFRKMQDKIYSHINFFIAVLISAKRYQKEQ
jgi:hypothetical protein